MGPKDADLTSALFVASAFDSAPSLSNTDVRFKPFFFFFFQKHNKDKEGKMISD